VDNRARDLQGSRRSHVWRLRVGKTKKRLCVWRRSRLVHEVDEDLTPARGGKAVGPVLEVVVGIVLQAQPDVTPRCRFDQGWWCIVLTFGKAKARAELSKHAVDVIVEPRVVAKLECRAVVRRQHLQKLR